MKLPAALVYTVLRLLFFLVPLGLMMLLPIFRDFWWLAALFAAGIGFALSMIFLRKPLSEVSEGLEARRARRRATDEDIEDEVVDTTPDGPADR